MASKGLNRKILVPVDFSNCSEEALVYACKMAACLHAGIVVLHVVHDPADMPGYYARITGKKQLMRIQDRAAEMFKDFISRAARKHHQIKDMKNLDSKLVVGLPVSRIIEVAKKIKPEMIVMGSYGATGLKYLMLGSRAEQVIRLSPIPVMVVKSKE